MKYEYKIQQTTAPTASEEQLSSDFGADGWLLQTIYEHGGNWYYVFARLLVN